VSRALVYGLAVAGESTVRALLRRGVDVVVADDDVDGRRRALAGALDVELLDRPDAAVLRDVIASCDLVSPAPGVPETHAVVAAARSAGVEVVSEIELAYRWEQERPGGPRPMLAITGTDGKTTTTLLAVEMLRAGGVRTIDAGNTSTPLVDAITMDLDAFVVECTSFRLAWTPTFRAEGAAWLNLAPDHLNWHRSMATYEAAKAQVWANQEPHDVAVGFVDDPIVMRRLRSAPARQVTFGASGADYRVEHGHLVGPGGAIASVSAMRRSLPHDLTNALAASALVLETGLADGEAIVSALASFTGHRIVSNTSGRGTTSRGTTIRRRPLLTRGRRRPVVRSPRADRRRVRQGRRPDSDGGRRHPRRRGHRDGRYRRCRRRSVRLGASRRDRGGSRRGGRARGEHRRTGSDRPPVTRMCELRPVHGFRGPRRTISDHWCSSVSTSTRWSTRCRRPARTERGPNDQHDQRRRSSARNARSTARRRSGAGPRQTHPGPRRTVGQP
jgi:hypothetical protein